MPAQKSVGLMAALGAAGRKAVATHKTDETKYPAGGNLPAGIEGGIAQLEECTFGKFKKGANVGKFFFAASAIIHTPEVFEGMRIKGRHTRVAPIPLCDTPNSKKKTLAEHIADVLNIFRVLGLDTSQFAEDDLEGMAKALTEAAPFFQFRTWKGEKQEIVAKNGKFFVGANSYATRDAAAKANPFAGKESRVQEVWERVVEDYVPAEGDAVVDEAASSDSPAAEAATDAPALDEGEEAALSDLIARADAGDPETDSDVADAQEKLEALAEQYGVAEDVANADNWEQAGEILEAAIANNGEGGGESGEATAEDAPFEPSKDDVVFYKPIDNKTKKPMKKGVQCEVTAVNKKSKKVDLKNLTTKVAYKTVSWSDLSDKA